MPQVSVIIPNYNHARFLDKRLHSVLSQTYQDIEIIYLDDASSDDSADVFAPYSDDGRIRSIHNQINSGSVFKQWNRGVREAGGEYIWIAESDDYADERFLERLVAALEAHPSAGVAYCQSVVVDDKDRHLSTMERWTTDLHPTRWQHDFFNIGRDECERYLSRKNTVSNASAVIFRRDVYLKAGGADETMRVCGDWKCWVECLLLSDVVYVSEPLNFFRRHDDSVRHQTGLNGTLFIESYQMLEFLRQRFSLSPSALYQARRRLRSQWMDTMLLTLCRNNPISWPRLLQSNLQIYRLAARQDSRLAFYLLKRIARGVLHCLLSHVTQ